MRTCKNGNSYEAANRLFTVRRDGTRRGGTDPKGSWWHAEQVLDYLNERETEDDSDPFLIYFGFSHPHDTRDGKPELLAKYGAVNHTDKNSLPPAHPKQPLLPINYLPAHPFNNTHMNVRDEVNVKGVWKNRDERTIRNELGREFACSENIDIQIGTCFEQTTTDGRTESVPTLFTPPIMGMAIGRQRLTRETEPVRTYVARSPDRKRTRHPTWLPRHGQRLSARCVEHVVRLRRHRAAKDERGDQFQASFGRQERLRS